VRAPATDRRIQISAACHIHPGDRQVRLSAVEVIRPGFHDNCAAAKVIRLGLHYNFVPAAFVPIGFHYNVAAAGFVSLAPSSSGHLSITASYPARSSPRFRVDPCRRRVHQPGLP
jgi:hypothetical protein